MFLCEPFTFASSFQAWQKQDVPVLHKLVVPVAEEAAIAATWQSLSILQVKMSTKPHTHTHTHTHLISIIHILLVCYLPLGCIETRRRRQLFSCNKQP